MINASRFAKLAVSGTGGRSFSFGCENAKEAAAVLRDMADLLESGLIMLGQVSSAQIAAQDDFLIHGLFIEFHVANEAALSRVAALNQEKA